MALQDRQPRSASRIRVSVDAARGQRRALYDRRHAARGRWRSMPRRARCCGCTAKTKASARTWRRGKLSGRGLAYWTDGREARILYVTPGYRLVALDAKTGTRIPGFGDKGIVDLKLDDDQEMDLVTGDIGYHAAPVVANERDRRRRRAYAGQHAHEHAEREGLRARLRRAHGQAPVDLPHHSEPGRIRQRDLGKRIRGPTRATPACGRRSRSTKSSAWSICRSRRRPTTTTAAIGRATDSSARAWSPSI